MILALGVWFGFTVRRFLPGLGGPTVYSSTTVLRQVQTLSQLVTVKYVMEKVVIFEDVKWYPGGDSRVLLVAHGVVKEIAYMGDMSIYLVQLDSGKIVRVTQPNVYRHADDLITWDQSVYVHWHPSSPVVLGE